MVLRKNAIFAKINLNNRENDKETIYFCIFVIAAFGLAAYTPDANAQAFLKKMKEKAESKLTEVITGKPSAKPAAAVTSSANANEHYNFTEENRRLFVEGLLPVDGTNEKLPSSNPENAASAKAMTFPQTFAAAHGLFKPEEALTPEGREKIMASYNSTLAVLDGFSRYSLENSMAQGQASGDVQVNVNQQGNQALLNISNEIMANLKAKGISMERATEAQMQEASFEVMGKKLGIPVADMRKMSKMSDSQVEAYIKTNYPKAEERARSLGLLKNAQPTGAEGMVAFMEIKNSILDLYTKKHGSFEQMGAGIGTQAANIQNLLAAAMAGDESASEDLEDSMAGSELDRTLSKLKREIRKSWTTSDAFAKVLALEEKFDANMEAFGKTDASDTAERYPSWYKEIRQEENRIISAWNLEQLTRYNKVLKEYADKLQPTLKQVVGYEAQIQKLGASKHDYFYHDALGTVNMFSGDLMEYLRTPYMILDCPQASSVNEDDHIVREDEIGGKG